MTSPLPALARAAVQRGTAQFFSLTDSGRTWASPFQPRPTTEIPARDWLLPGHLARGFVSATVGAGGVGKSTLAIHHALSLATGFPLLGVMPKERTPVWFWNGEDPADEIERRVHAAMHFHGISETDLGGRLFLGSGREQPMIVASGSPAEVHEATVCAIIARVHAENIGAVFIDPFISSHRVAETNENFDRVIKTWNRIAEDGNCAVDLNHHFRKTGDREVTVEDARGGSSLHGAVRIMRILRPMAENEASSFGVDPEDRFAHIRVELGKGNMTAIGQVSWFQLVSVSLPNGDDVQAVQPFTPPDPFAEVSNAEVRQVQSRIAAGRGQDREGWRFDAQTGDAWAGHVIAASLGLDVNRPPHLRRVKNLLGKWIDAGTLKIERRSKGGPRGKAAPFVEVGRWVEE